MGCIRRVSKTWDEVYLKVPIVFCLPFLPMLGREHGQASRWVAERRYGRQKFFAELHIASIVPKSSFFQLLFLLAELIPSEFL